MTATIYSGEFAYKFCGRGICLIITGAYLNRIIFTILESIYILESMVGPVFLKGGFFG
jgi:hypothetical protein